MSLFVNLISTFDDAGLKKADTAVGGTESKLGNFGKAAGVAFAAAGAAALAYAGTLLVDGVKSAIEDEKAQIKLATALKNSADATTAQIDGVEDYITKAGVAYGITDDQLRPAFERLARSTGDIDEAQKLTNIAMDVAAGTGKSVEQVATALGKAYDGNVGALTRLGVPLDENIIKSKDFDGAMAALNEQFGGQAAAQAATFEGKMTRLGVAFDEAKETAGSFILDAIQPLADFAVTTLIPAMSSLGSTIGETLGPVVSDLGKFFVENILPAMKDIGEFVMGTLIPNFRDALTPVIDGLKSAFNAVMGAINDNKPAIDDIMGLFKGLAGFISEYVAPIVGTTLGGAFTIAGDAIGLVLGIIGKVITAFGNMVRFFREKIGIIKETFENIRDAIMKPFKMAFKAVAEFWNDTLGKFKIKLPDWLPLIGGKEFGFPKLPIPALAKGGIIANGPQLAMIGEAGPEAVIPLSKGKKYGLEPVKGGINITVNGALDPEAVARQIETILRRSILRAGAYR